MEWLVPILDAVLGSLVRSALMMITGFLLERHLVSQQIADQFVSDGVTHVIIAVPALLALAWSVWVKVRGRARFLTALQATPGTTEDQVKAKVSAGMGVSVKAGAVVLACVLGTAASACGPKQLHTAVVANTAIAQAIFALQDSEIAAHNAGLITSEKHAAYKAQILKLLQAGDDLTLALKAWDPSQPAPANISLAIGEVSGLLRDLQLNSPQANGVLFAVQTVLSVLRGSGVLPPPELTIELFGVASKEVGGGLVVVEHMLVPAVNPHDPPVSGRPHFQTGHALLRSHDVAEAREGRIVVEVAPFIGQKRGERVTVQRGDCLTEVGEDIDGSLNVALNLGHSVAEALRQFEDERVESLVFHQQILLPAVARG